MNIKLTRIESTHNNLRTDSTVGTCVMLPTVGFSFVVLGDSLTEGLDWRLITTTEVTELRLSKGVYYFKTKNSSYTLEVLP